MKSAFLASKFGEFSKIRKILVEELLQIGIKPIDLNDNSAVPYPPLERSLQSVRESDIFILLIGDEYGTIPSGKSKSITHLEYIEALNNNKEIYVFGIGKLYRDEEIIFSTDSNMRAWQEEILQNWVISKFGDDESIKSVAYNIIMDIYKEENLTWIDDDTGLMWQVQVETHEKLGRHPWTDLVKYKDQLNKRNYAEYNDWRVPTFNELITLKIQESYPNPNSNYGETFIKKPLLYSMAMEHGRFWSSTSNKTDLHLAYGVYFNRIRKKSNSENGKRPKRDGLYVRCVRLNTYEEIEKDWSRVKESENIQEIESFITKYPESKYVNVAEQAIKVLKGKYEGYIKSLPLFEKFLVLYEEEKYTSSRESFLLEKIKEITNDVEKCKALEKLKVDMVTNKKWKNPFDTKSPDKNKNKTKYKITQSVIELLDDCDK